MSLPLPTSRAALIAQRKTPIERTLNDRVEQYHLDLWDDKQYRRFLDATSDEDTAEGSLAADNLEAANMIRMAALNTKDEILGEKKKATIVKALNVVLRRYRISRQERATRLGDENYPGNNGE
jgi:hypothetical protein